MTRKMSTADSSASDESAERSVQPLAEHLPNVADWVPDALSPYWDLVSQIPVIGALILAVTFLLLAIALRFAIAGSIGRLVGLTASALDDQPMTISAALSVAGARFGASAN